MRVIMMGQQMNLTNGSTLEDKNSTVSSGAEPLKSRSFCRSDPFTHNWLNQLELQRVDSPTGRYYVTPEGKNYPSVTTFLSKTEDSDYIQEWRNAVGEQEANRVSRRASTRGSQLHENAESYLRNIPVEIPKVRMLDLSLMTGIIPALNRIDNIRLLESQLYSHAFKLAGTVDCLAEFDGELAVIDFKTSSKQKGKEEIDNYFIQTAIYSWMIEERYGIRVPKLVIIISEEFGNAKVYVENRKNWFEPLKQRLLKFRR